MKNYRVVRVSKGWVPQTSRAGSPIPFWVGLGNSMKEYGSPEEQLKYCIYQTKEEAEEAIAYDKVREKDKSILISN